MILLLSGAQSSQVYRGRKQNEGWGRGPAEELVFRGDRISIGEDEKVLEMDVGEGCTRV